MSLSKWGTTASSSQVPALAIWRTVVLSGFLPMTMRRYVVSFGRWLKLRVMVMGTPPSPSKEW